MDPRDRNRPAPDGVASTACGASVPVDRDALACTPRFASTVIGCPVTTSFAHASEAEMARILDFYAVRWEYEPHTFPILWNLEGDVVESFSPDFYLPDLDCYLEMTTLRQKLVRKKNRKLRRLRELYPDLNVKLFYARDFRALMLKYGTPGAGRRACRARSGQVARPRRIVEAGERAAGRRRALVVGGVDPAAVATARAHSPSARGG